jgi:hypothetical protein
MRMNGEYKAQIHELGANFSGVLGGVLRASFMLISLIIGTKRSLLITSQ